MSFDNILGNLVATAIWAILAAFVSVTVYLYGRSRKARLEVKKLIEMAKELPSLGNTYERRFIFISYLQIVRSSLEHTVYMSAFSVLLQAVILLSPLMNPGGSSLIILIFLSLSFVIIGFGIIGTVLSLMDLHHFEMAFMNGLRESLKS